MGVILQRGALVLLLCCFPCWALFLNTQHILLLCRQDPAVSRYPGRGDPWRSPPPGPALLWAPSCRERGPSGTLRGCFGVAPVQPAAPAVASRGQTNGQF